MFVFIGQFLCKQDTSEFFVYIIENYIAPSTPLFTTLPPWIEEREITHKKQEGRV